LRFIGKIFAFDREYLFLTHYFEVNPKLQKMKFGVEKLKTSLYRTVETHFDVLNYVGVHGSFTSVMDRQTDRRTDRQNGR